MSEGLQRLTNKARHKTTLEVLSLLHSASIHMKKITLMRNAEITKP